MEPTVDNQTNARQREHAELADRLETLVQRGSIREVRPPRRADPIPATHASHESTRREDPCSPTA